MNRNLQYDTKTRAHLERLEPHIHKIYVVASAPDTLPVSVATASRAVDDVNAEPALDTATEDLSIEDKDTVPVAHLRTLLDNLVICKRAPVDRAMQDIREEAQFLFIEHLRSKGFKKFESPGLIDAASEGGTNVLQLPYFGENA